MKIFAAICFFGLSAILIFCDLNNHKRIAVSLALAASVFGSYITSQRTIYFNDDIVEYYNIFLALGQGDWSRVGDLGGGIEFLLPLIFKVFYFVFGDISLQNFIFFLTFFGVASAIITYSWLIPQVAGKEEFCLKLSFSVAYVSFFTASHTARQFLAGVMLLPLLVLHNLHGKAIILASLSPFAHITSVVFVSVITMCRSFLFVMLLLTFGLLIALNIDEILTLAFDLLPEVIHSKLMIINIQETGNDQMTNIPDFIRLALLSLFVAVSRFFWPASVPHWTSRFVYLILLAFMVTLDVNFVGTRIAHILLYVGFGIILVMALQKSILAMRIVVVVGLLQQTRLLLSY